MDEIGFIVRHVRDDGFVRVSPVGHHDPRMLLGQRLTIHGEAAPVSAITGALPAHVLPDAQRYNVPAVDELFLDIGAGSSRDAHELGVAVGNQVTFATAAESLNGGDLFVGKAVDDRAGCAVLCLVMKMLAETEHAPTVVAVGTTCEELGAWGAGPAAVTVRPDHAVAIDVTIAGDIPGAEFDRHPIHLGRGPAIKHYDWVPGVGRGSVVPEWLTRDLVRAAAAAGVDCQHEVLVGGSTDAATIVTSGPGTPAGCVSLPARYIHSAVGTVSRADLIGAACVLTRYVLESSAPDDSASDLRS
jgi:endoglucanase